MLDHLPGNVIDSFFAGPQCGSSVKVRKAGLAFGFWWALANKRSVHRTIFELIQLLRDLPPEGAGHKRHMVKFNWLAALLQARALVALETGLPFAEQALAQVMNIHSKRGAHHQWLSEQAPQIQA